MYIIRTTFVGGDFDTLIFFLLSRALPREEKIGATQA